MTAREIIEKYISFFEKKGHKRIPNAPLVPQNDPTTLFTSSGMQPLVPYLLGEEHPMGKRLVNVQNSFRAQDIDEVGDNRHTTFFRMLGNWSLGDYFKKEQISWLFEFLTNKTEGLGLDPQKLYVTAFKGNDQVTQDKESIEIWQTLFKEKSIDAKLNERIFLYDVEQNWWSRSGTPDKMPIGEPGGPDSEVFYDFGTPHTTVYGRYCHPNCNCGRFMEIGNSVFMEYKKINNTTFEELPNKNVDFGGGLERLLAAVENKQDIFETSLYRDIIEEIEIETAKKYSEQINKAPMRIIADHLKAATFLIIENIAPSNKTRGYVLRRLLRRSAMMMHRLKGGLTPIGAFQTICDRGVLRTEETVDEKIDRSKARNIIFPIIEDELSKFGTSLDKGLTNFDKGRYELQMIINKLSNKPSFLPMGREAAKIAFNLYQSYGFPIDIFMEMLKKEFTIAYEFGADEMIIEEFNKLKDEHSQQARTASSGMFKGGLADHQEKTIMGHTATHLLHQALRDVFGTKLHQTGSNITADRVRFDFNFDRNLIPDELKKVEDIVNEKIRANLPVHFEMLALKKAKEIGAIGLFDDKYANTVKIYFIGNYSKEFCGGPHVVFTSQIKSFKIFKQENIGKGIRRIYAKVG